MNTARSPSDPRAGTVLCDACAAASPDSAALALDMDLSRYLRAGDEVRLGNDLTWHRVARVQRIRVVLTTRWGKPSVAGQRLVRRHTPSESSARAAAHARTCASL